MTDDNKPGSGSAGQPDQGTKQGRPRFYPSRLPDGFASDGVGYHAIELAEFRERMYDQIEDLPLAAINFVAPDSSLSIGWLATHMVAAEVHWVSRLSGDQIPQSITGSENFTRLTPYGPPPGEFGSAATLVSLGRQSYEDFTLPRLQAVPDISASTRDDRLRTAGDVLRHLVWHWIYHSGHIGLVRLQWGSEYDWTFAPPAE